jgi:quercetin dioxygenase-like cupin family protein
MDATTFEAALRQDGFTEVERKTVEPRLPSKPHSHPFDVRALVLDGEITLSSEGADRVYRAGDIFTMAAGCVHSETYGPNGLTYVIGRRHSGT